MLARHAVVETIITSAAGASYVDRECVVSNWHDKGRQVDAIVVAAGQSTAPQ